ncbi:MAG: hypothetical protein SFX18_12825 [Pirellulales bacterium]|nr:hypothetical protein [Pirellulales bacterium]
MNNLPVRLFLACVGLLGGSLCLWGADDVLTRTYPGSDKPGELTCEANYYLWLPPNAKTIRGIIVHQHGCGDGAERGCLEAARDQHWRALAAKWDCALLGTSYRAGDANCAAWSDPARGSQARFLQALSDFAANTKHPELATAPWCLWGHSGGAWWASNMLARQPERCVAVWLRSGSAFGPPREDKQQAPAVPEAAYRVPVMCNPGEKERNDERFHNAYNANAFMFVEWRKQGALIGFAAEPNCNHECGQSRYLAIPWFDAILAARLPDKPTEPLKTIAEHTGWLAPFGSCIAVPPDKYTGDMAHSIWLPNSAIAQKWCEYVQSGSVSDTTPPPPPANVKLAGKLLSWRADADLDSGLRGFSILQNGKEIARLPEKQESTTLFQGLTYHDTPLQPCPVMEYTLADPTGEIRLISHNTVGLASEPSLPALRD